MSSEQGPSVAVFSTAPVSAVSIKIPPFWSNDPALWFSQVEAQFTLKGITSQLTKFHYIVASLEPQIALHVRPLILNPPASNPYDTLKILLLQSFTPSQQSRLQQVFSADSLGDMKPTELFLHLQKLLGESATDESLLRNVFLLRLPLTIRTSLAVMQDKPLSQLVQLADTLFELAPPSMAAVAPTQSSCDGCARLEHELEVLKSRLLHFENASSNQPQRFPVRRRSPSPRRTNFSPPSRSTLCWYHEKFGSRAVKCTPPCQFSSN